MRDRSGEGRTGWGELGYVERGRDGGLGQVREPGRPTSHLVPRHSVHHVHLTEEKRWWPQRPHGEAGVKAQRGWYLGLAQPRGGITLQDSLLQGEPQPSLSCTAFRSDPSPTSPPPGSPGALPVLHSLLRSSQEEVGWGDPATLLPTGWGRGLTPIPHEQVDQDGDGEEDASMGGMSAEEQHEVAQEAEQHNPDHVQLEEVVEAEEPSRHGACVLQVGWQPFGRERRRSRKGG